MFIKILKQADDGTILNMLGYGDLIDGIDDLIEFNNLDVPLINGKVIYKNGNFYERETFFSDDYKNIYEELIKKDKYKYEINILKEFLSSTDYVITKLNEAKIEDETEFQKLKLEYANVLAKRKETRIRINELESGL